MLEMYIKSRDMALAEEISGKARTYVVIDTNLNYIVGYFSLRAGQCYVGKKKMFKKNKLIVFPGIELAMIAVNSNYKEMHKEFHYTFGRWLFKQFVLPKVEEASKLIGVQVLYLFALPNNSKLIKFYENLGFVNPGFVKEKSKNMETIIPAFDDGCIFMYRLL